MATRSAAGSANAPSVEAPEWVVFSCDAHRFAVPLRRVREILTPRPLTRIPGCGPEVAGLIGLRGRAVTVLDVGALLGFHPSAGRPRHRILLVERGERMVGLAVDAAVGVAPGGPDSLAVPGPALAALGIGRDEMVGVGEMGESAFLALDPDRIIGRLLDD